MRLFTALDLPPEMLLRLERLLAALRSEAPVKWTSLDNLHITTKFIGEWLEQRLDQLDSALQRVGSAQPVEIQLFSLGWFPNAHSPRVLWAGVDGGEALPKLAEQTETALSSLGVQKEQQPFSPHLTLARIKTSIPLQSLRAKVEELQPAAIGQFCAPGFFLYRSDPGSNASIYRKIRSYPFKPA